MTREETIEEVKNYENYPNGLSKECRDYIIKALEQELIIEEYEALKRKLHEAERSAREKIKELRQEPCEDAISRTQALSDYADWYGYGYRENTFYKLLKDMPPVQPKTECSCEQIKWERDMAIAQLNELGYGLGEKPKAEKCKWIRYDYRTICPQNHDIDNPYWRIPENTECLKYCPYCGKEIEVMAE